MTEEYKKVRFLGALDAKYFDQSAKGTVQLAKRLDKVVKGEAPPFGPPVPQPVSFLDPEEAIDPLDCLVVFLLDEERDMICIARAPRLTDVSVH